MLNTDQILRILQESALLFKHDIIMSELRGRELSNREYSPEELPEFQRDLIETGNSIRILLLEYTLDKKAFLDFIKEFEFPVLVFRPDSNTYVPELLLPSRKGIDSLIFTPTETKESQFSLVDLERLENEGGDITFLAITEYDNLVSESDLDEDGIQKDTSPVKRLFKLLKAEKKDIYYVFFYAFIVGMISLIIPLGIQTTTELISGGVFFSSIYLLIGLIIVGVLTAGVLQIFQLTMVEYLQRRVFTKAAYEFAFRLPRIKNEALSGKYAPELVNRFFDVLTIQKGLPKLLIDLSSAVLQILFGLLLISLYHPFFVFFGIVLLMTLFLIFFFTGPSGLKSSILESKYKYQVVYWLQELGRSLNSFKVTGNSNLPIRKTDFNVNNYLKYRKNHFKILVSQYSYIVLFKTAITAALLIMGAILVMEREITLGQFVASEVIIIMILSSVEKIISYMDVVYDMLTAVDKIAHVTDLPLEKSGGVDFPKSVAHMPFSVDVKGMSFKYAESKTYIIKNIDLSIKAGDHICISGPGNSGKTTLAQLISGLHGDFEGSIKINQYSIRDLDLTNLRDRLAKNISTEDIFDGSVLENITVGKSYVTVQMAIEAMEKTGIYDWVNELPEGLNTNLISGGKGLSSSVVLKLILARCIAKQPSLIILNDYFSGLSKIDKLKLISMLSDPKNKWTLIAVSNDPMIMAGCDRIVVLKDGQKQTEGSYKELLNKNMLNEFID